MSILIKMERCVLCLLSRRYWIHCQILTSGFIDLLLEKLQHAHTNECIRIGNGNRVSRIQVPKMFQSSFKRDSTFSRSAREKSSACRRTATGIYFRQSLQSFAINRCNTAASECIFHV